MSIFLVLLMYGLWSTIFSIGKLTLIQCPPLFLTASRMLLAGVLLLGFLGVRNRTSFKMGWRGFFALCLIALFTIYLTNALEFWSLQYLTAAKTCFIYSLTPFFSILFSYLHFKEKMNKRKWLGVMIGFLGVFPIFAIQKGADELISTVPFLSWPELGMVGAVVFSSYGWILLRMVVKSSISPLMANGMSMVIGGSLALLHSFLAENWNPIPVQPPHMGGFVQGVLLMTLISNIICQNLYGLLLKKFTATFLSFMGLLCPIFASLSSRLFLKESLSPVIFISTGIVAFGLWLVYSAELKQGYIQKAEPESVTT